MRLLQLLLIALIVSAGAAPVVAEERPHPAIEFAAGVLSFPDDGVVNEGLAGGAARFYVTPRLSVGPEIAFVNGDRHSHLMLTGNATFDLVSPVNGRARPITPFVVAGGGLFQTRETFLNNARFTSNEGAFTAGGGFRAAIGNRAFAGAEVRAGWELHVRYNGLIGIRFGE